MLDNCLTRQHIKLSTDFKLFESAVQVTCVEQLSGKSSSGHTHVGTGLPSSPLKTQLASILGLDVSMLTLCRAHVNRLEQSCFSAQLKT